MDTHVFAKEKQRIKHTNEYVTVISLKDCTVLVSHKRRRNYCSRDFPEWLPYPSWHHTFPLLTHVCHLDLPLFIKTSWSVKLEVSTLILPQQQLACTDSWGELVSSLPLTHCLWTHSSCFSPCTAQLSPFPVCRLCFCSPTVLHQRNDRLSSLLSML